MAKKKNTGNKGEMKTIIMSETNIQEQPGPAGHPIIGISDSAWGGRDIEGK